VRQLLRYAALRLQAVQAGVTAIERKRDLVSVRFRQDAPVDPGKLASFVSSQRGAQFLPDGTLKFLAKGLDARELLEQLQTLLGNLAENILPSIA
jgi:transcription-repair coupling factor (superfamily II helicase)